MKIIKGPNLKKLNPIFKSTCNKCECEFEYERADIQSAQREGSWVVCPGCNNFITHR